MTKIKCITPTWEDMQKYANITANKIKKSDFHPDVIIGLSRGGLVPARMFCDLLHIKNCYTIKVDHWGLTATKDGQAKLSQELNMDLTGKKVLIVDDITDTGQSMELAKNHILSKNPTQLMTATLIHLSNSKYIPDFFGIEREWAWIIFPWNYKEDLVNLIKKISEFKTLSNKEIKDKLFEYNDLNIPIEDIEDVIEHINYLEKLK